MFCAVSYILTNLLILVSDSAIEQRPDIEKKSPYECGFQPFNFELQQFDVKYYIVALLFLIFDVEIAFIIPFVNVSYFLNFYVFVNFFSFFLFLFLGLFYEWKNNFLDWE